MQGVSYRVGWFQQVTGKVGGGSIHSDLRPYDLGLHLLGEFLDLSMFYQLLLLVYPSILDLMPSTNP